MSVTLVLAYLAIDELEIPRTLSIAISSTILGTCLVRRVLLQATICVHRDEIQRTVEATGEVGQINIECKFLIAGEFEHLFMIQSSRIV